VQSKRERPYESIAVSKPKDSLKGTVEPQNEVAYKTKYHKVHRGESLAEIAAQYHVSIEDLKKWNYLRSNKNPKRRTLKIKITEDVVKNDANETEDPKIKNSVIASADTKQEKDHKIEKVVTTKEVTKIHKVKKGDNLTEIANKYGVTLAEIKKWNQLKDNNIALGESIKIIKTEKVTTWVKKETKQPIVETKEAVVATESKTNISETTKTTENYYVVAKGDYLFSIAKKHNISVAQLKEWNNIIDNNVKVGTQLIISEDSVAQAKIEATAPKKEYKNIEHIVEKGEYLGTIARKYKTSINDLLEWNSLSDSNIKLGDKLIVGKEEIITSKEALVQNNKDKKTSEIIYQVRKGDTLLKITQKFPGVTISDLKKWNNIKGESLKPGMKLKING